MKKQLVLFALVIVCLALCACGNSAFESDTTFISSVTEESVIGEGPDQSKVDSSELVSSFAFSSEADFSSETAFSSASSPEEDTGISEIGSITEVSSKAGGFLVQYNSTYLATEGEGGEITIFLRGKTDTVPFVEIARIKKNTAEKYLSAQKNELANLYADDLLSFEAPEPLNLEDHDMYSAGATILIDGKTFLVSHFAENREGNVLSFRAFYLAEDADVVTEALQLAISSLNIADEESAVASATPEPAPEIKGTIEETGEIAGWTYELSTLDNGDIEYLFNDVLAIDLPASWDGKYEMDASTEHMVTFYHIKSRAAWSKSGQENAGKLFSIIFSEAADYKNLPSYRDLGPAEGGYYYFMFPTDTEGYADNGPIAEEYEELMMDMNYVEENSYSLLVP